MKTLIKNALIINEGKRFHGHVIINNEYIEQVIEGKAPPEIIDTHYNIIDAKGLFLIPGVIDDQVHFREPGLTHKGDISSESRAAVAGGVTSFMEMPNTIPQSTTQDLLEEKYKRAAEVSLANFSFYMGATNDNLDQVLVTDPARVCGIKVFMGSSTGNMLVDDNRILAEIFRHAPTLVATHCEDETIIRKNIMAARDQYGENVPFSYHPVIRNAEACYKSSSAAVELASKYGTRLHVLHLSSAQEMGLFSPGPVKDKKITAEVCVHHLWFTDHDYAEKGSYIKWNPAIKNETDRQALREAVLSGRIDVVATDHAPHTIEEKDNSYFKAPSGGPLVQHSLTAMLEMTLAGIITPEKVVEKMCHAPADLFRIIKRGYIREGYFADLVLINPEQKWTVSKENLLYKCGWSPFENCSFSHMVTHTFVNGKLVWNKGMFSEEFRGKRLMFEPGN
jgi:dihydroorotase